jgi:uncharacterized RDD family membrane protein YckC
VSTPSDPGSGQPDPWAAPPPGTPGPGAPPPPPPNYPPAPPPDYGQPPAGYGQPPPGYGQPAPGYGQPAPGYGYPTGPTFSYANWGQRVASACIDYIVPSIIASVFRPVSIALYLILSLAALAWALYNAYQSGATGQSIGKKMVGTRLVRFADGQPIGGGLAIGRYFLHILDALPCLLGYLWPLWDAKKQTFADKIVGSVVIGA